MGARIMLCLYANTTQSHDSTHRTISKAVLLNGYYLVEASGAEGGEEKVVASLDRLMAQLKPLVHMQPWG